MEKKEKKPVAYNKMKSKYAHFGLFFIVGDVCGNFPRISMRIRVTHLETSLTDNTLRWACPLVAPPPRCKDGELSEGRRIAVAMEVALLLRRARCRHFFCPASVLVLVWSLQVSWFQCGPQVSWF